MQYYSNEVKCDCVMCNQACEVPRAPYGPEQEDVQQGLVPGGVKDDREPWARIHQEEQEDHQCGGPGSSCRGPDQKIRNRKVKFSIISC